MTQSSADHSEHISGDIKDDLIKRLRRIEGQVRAMEKFTEVFKKFY